MIAAITEGLSERKVDKASSGEEDGEEVTDNKRIANFDEEVDAEGKKKAPAKPAAKPAAKPTSAKRPAPRSK